MCARDPRELKSKAGAYQGHILTERRKNLQVYIAEVRLSIDGAGVAENGDDPPVYDQKMLTFLEGKAAANESLWTVYNGAADERRHDEFFEVSKRTWAEALPDALQKINDALEGPYCLGEQVVRTISINRSSLLNRFSPFPDTSASQTCI